MNAQSHIDQRTDDLLNGSIDGELSTAQQAEMEQLLATSSRVRDSYDELKQVTEVLDSLPEREPPEYLQNVIESQLSTNLPGSAKETKNGFFGTWLPAHWMPAGMALAAAVVLTVGVYEMGSEPMTARDAANMVGTVVPGQALDRAGLLDSFNINTDTLSGFVELRSADGFITLDMKLNSAVPAEVVVSFSGYGLEIEAISGLQDNENAVVNTDGSIKLTIHGQQHLTMQLRQTAQTQQAAGLELEFFAQNTLVHAARMSVSRQ